MARVSPEEGAQAWSSGLGRSTDKITKGIQRVTVAPGQAAARQKAVYLQNVTAKVDKWATNVARVQLGDWQNDAINKGVPRIASGAAAAQPKMAAFNSAFYPFLDQVKSQLPARGDLNANIQRAVKQITLTAAFKR